VNIAEEIPNWNSAVVEIQGILQNNPALIEKAKSYGDIYKGRRGLMVVDVICSRQRNYEKKVIANLLPSYESKAKDLSLKSLALKAPTWMKIMKVEPLTMQLVAQKLLDFGDKNNLVEEDAICRNWAVSDLHWLMLEVNGIGPVLLEYLRMLSGFDTLKLDVNVGRALSTLGIQTKGYSADIVLKICQYLCKDVGCTLIALDQALFQLGQLESVRKIRSEKFVWTTTKGLI
jgi:hypothetical protein